MTWGINLPCSAPASLIVDTVEKMSDLTRRAVAIGAPLACGALVMHMYASMSFEHEAQILLYCVYIIFVYVVWPLFQRRTDIWQHRSRMATVSTLLILFTLGSAQVALLIGEMLSPSEDVKAIVASSQSLIYALSNLVTGVFFIYRLYVIGTHKRPLFVLPIVLGYLVGNICFGFVGTSRTPSSYTGKEPGLLTLNLRALLLYNLATHTAMGLLIMGQIWWISRQIRAILGKEVAGTLETVTAMILESGLAYSVAMASCLFAREDLLPNMLSNGVVFAVLTQVAGIVSTTALVQSARGINIVDVKIEVVENAVSGWSLSRLDFEQTTNENSARRSASSETRTLIQTRSEQIGDLEAGKDRR